MSHVEKKRKRPPDPVKRVRRQSETLERAIERDKARTHVLHPATSSRGTLDGFTAEVTEDRVRKHTVDATASRTIRALKAVEEQVEIVHARLT